jgi:aspartate kinase
MNKLKEIAYKNCARINNLPIVVQKYGGSSVADIERIQNVGKRIRKRVQQGNKLVVVVSAMGKTTDNLIKLAKQLIAQPDARELDQLMATGEQVSASLLAMALQSMKLKSRSLNAYQARIHATGKFSEARIKDFDKKHIMQLLKTHDVLVVTGFQGISESGDIATLGRGGSDTSAVALAAALNAPCEIYSDVAGIYTTDPKLYPAARKAKLIAYDDMLELAGSGAKVLHGRSVEVAKRFNIPIYCGSSFSDEEGSYVVSEELIIEKSTVTGLSVMENQVQVVIKKLPLDYSLVREIFQKAATTGLNVDMISIINDEDGISISFTVVDEKKKRLEAALKKVLKELSDYELHYYTGYVKISVVGVGMKSGIGVAAEFFNALKNVPFKLVTTSEIKISCLIEQQHKTAAVNALVKKFKL